MKNATAPRFSETEIQHQREIAARAPKVDGLFAHIGFLRSSPRGRAGSLGIRFYPTSDLLGQRLEYGAIWESIGVCW